MGLIESLAKRVSQQAVIVQKQQVAAHTYRITLELPEHAKPLNYTPGEFLRVLVGLNKPVKVSEMVRTYSVWSYDQAKRMIDIAVCTFSSGSGAAWAKQAKAGDTVHFTGPKGKFTVDDSGEQYILIGDISSLAHLYELNRHLSARKKKVHGIVYAQQEGDFFPDLNGETPLSFHILPEHPVQPLIERLEPIVQSAAGGKGIVYIGGDGRVCAELNAYFRTARHGGSWQVKSKPFWYPGKTGLE
ncbi:siderophore-interacting protein [Paenibacillus silvisoli]|uniref:siderophore-interacting protein n=1 Tax=Paenibacillus silvisoli TaxID=3110539 RepID=UPI0028051C08|nr:siderophore-interacting protein [Paenibacillus silvisoli]